MNDQKVDSSQKGPSNTSLILLFVLLAAITISSAMLLFLRARDNTQTEDKNNSYYRDF